MNTVKVFDTSHERPTAENFLKDLKEAVKEAESNWKAKIIAVVTDASGECLKGRRLYVKENPSVVVLNCMAHQVCLPISILFSSLIGERQINLIVGDYFAATKANFGCIDEATEFITWGRSRRIINAWLRQASQKDSVSFKTAGITRWTSHFIAIRNLLHLQPFLIIIFDEDDREPASKKLIVTGNKKTREKAQAMMSLCRRETFWLDLTRCIFFFSLLVPGEY